MIILEMTDAEAETIIGILGYAMEEAELSKPEEKNLITVYNKLLNKVY